MISEPTATCPRCKAEVVDMDGFGVLIHDDCGYCSHPSITGDTCDSCNAKWEAAREDGQ